MCFDSLQKFYFLFFFLFFLLFWPKTGPLPHRNCEIRLTALTAMVPKVITLLKEPASPTRLYHPCLHVSR